MLDLTGAAVLSVSLVSPRPGARLIRASWRRLLLSAWSSSSGTAKLFDQAGDIASMLLPATDDAAGLAAAVDEARPCAQAALAAAARTKTAALVPGEPGYPRLLAAIPDPPPLLWVRGDPTVLERHPLVAIVGARAASTTSLEIAFRLAADLGRHGIVVVSGMARGIDGAAHRGALESGGATIAVLGCGTDVVYPREHDALACRIAARGAIVSEYPPGTPPRSALFPARNRIISGLAAGVVVVEAGEKSGSLITARAALEQGREVMAVPGGVAGGRSRGCNALIKDGAALVENAGDVLAALEKWQVFREWMKRVEPESKTLDPILASMETGEPYDLDSLAALTSLDPVALLPRLLEMELSGSIFRDPAGRFVRSSGSC